MLKRDLIGTIYSVIAPNGLEMTVTISDDPKEFALYKRLGLPVFHHVETKPLIPLKPIDPNDMSWADLKKYAKEKGIAGKTKKEILNAIAEGAK